MNLTRDEMNDTYNTPPTPPVPEDKTELPAQDSQSSQQPVVDENIALSSDEINKADSDANFAITTGVGIGALGVGASLLTAATCPLCVVIAPALVGVGVYKKYKLRKQKK